MKEDFRDSLLSIRVLEQCIKESDCGH